MQRIAISLRLSEGHLQFRLSFPPSALCRQNLGQWWTKNGVGRCCADDALRAKNPGRSKGNWARVILRATSCNSYSTVWEESELFLIIIPLSAWALPRKTVGYVRDEGRVIRERQRSLDTANASEADCGERKRAGRSIPKDVMLVAGREEKEAIQTLIQAPLAPARRRGGVQPMRE